MKISEEDFENRWGKIFEYAKGERHPRLLQIGSLEEIKDLYKEALCHNRGILYPLDLTFSDGKLTELGELFCYGHILKTRVVNIYKDNYEIYIGRAKKSIFGNPFKLREPNDDLARYRCLIDFIEWLEEENPPVLDHVESLHGKIIGCHCAPRACHGHVYAALGKVERSQYVNVLRDLKIRAGLKCEEIKNRQDKQLILF